MPYDPNKPELIPPLLHTDPLLESARILNVIDRDVTCPGFAPHLVYLTIFHHDTPHGRRALVSPHAASRPTICHIEMETPS